MSTHILCWFFHDWSRWVVYKPTSGLFRHLRQQKRCSRCGFTRDEQLRAKSRDWDAHEAEVAPGIDAMQERDIRGFDG